jgi:hypothetical protein
MVVIGVDAHQRTHPLVVADQVGRELASRTFPATLEGTGRRLAGCQRGRSRRSRSGTAGSCPGRLQADLLRAGERVVRVPARGMASARPARPRAGHLPPDRRLSGGAGCAARAWATGCAACWPDPPAGGCWWTTVRIWWLSGPHATPAALAPARSSRSAGRAPQPGGLQVIAALDRRLQPVEGTVAAVARELLWRIRELDGAQQPAPAGDHSAGAAAGADPAGLAWVRAAVGCQAPGEVAGAARLGPGRRLPAGTALRRSRCGRATLLDIG